MKNEEQTRYWDTDAGERWVRYRNALDRQLEPLGMSAIESAAPQAGESVLDVGCGCGATTRALARAVGREGYVTGVDLSAAMLEQARDLHAELSGETAAPAEYLEADAQTWPFTPDSFHLIYSRFGVMFFEDPVAAFANLHRATAAGGRLSFVCWNSAAQNPWMMLPVLAAAPFVTMDSMPAADAPGPFAFADHDRVKGILTAAGWNEAVATDHHETLTIADGGDMDECVDFVLRLGPLSRPMAEADAETQAKVRSAVLETLAPYYGENGLQMDSATRVWTARK